PAASRRISGRSQRSSPQAGRRTWRVSWRSAASTASSSRLRQEENLTKLGGTMADTPPAGLKDGAQCKVVGGTHAGKAGTVRDINTSKTGHVTITVVQANGDRFKTLARSVTIEGMTA